MTCSILIPFYIMENHHGPLLWGHVEKLPDGFPVFLLGYQRTGKFFDGHPGVPEPESLYIPAVVGCHFNQPCLFVFCSASICHNTPDLEEFPLPSARCFLSGIRRARRCPCGLHPCPKIFPGILWLDAVILMTRNRKTKGDLFAKFFKTCQIYQRNAGNKGFI